MDSVHFVLASASPRRRALLRLLNLKFDVYATDADEVPKRNEPAFELVQRLSRAKAEVASRKFPDSAVIAADTDVDLDGIILGKPRDGTDAVAMLRALRGREHVVYGGVTIAEKGKLETLVVRTRVRMRNYRDDEIDKYVSTGDPLDKAAAYGVQNMDFHPVERVQGCFANVMGLPLCRLYHALSNYHKVPDPDLECHLHPEVDCSVEKQLAETH